MNKKIIPIILVSFSCFLSIVAITLVLNTNHFKLSNKTETNNKESVFKEEIQEIVDSNSNQQEVTNKEEINNKEEVTINNENNLSPNNNKETSNNIEIITDEATVINYFNEQEEFINGSTNQEDSSLREKAKNAFVTIIDFIFYDKKIKGYTFNELTTKAKLEIIEIALTIDDKIDKHFPDYKEVIKEKYTSIKGQLAVKYIEFTSTLCETVGTDVCNQAKDNFNKMKESFNFTWQFIKELASNGSNKIKEFYESWRDA